MRPQHLLCKVQVILTKQTQAQLEEGKEQQEPCNSYCSGGQEHSELTVPPGTPADFYEPSIPAAEHASSTHMLVDVSEVAECSRVAPATEILEKR